MARGKRRTQEELLNDKLEKLNSDILNMEESIKEKKQQKEEIENELRALRMKELDHIISDKGLTMEDVKKMLLDTM